MQLSDYEIKTTLTQASMDDSGNSVIDSTQEVYHFDKITKKVADRHRVSKPQHSCDALYIKDDDNIFLLEFKNTRSSYVPYKSLKLKAYDSIMTLMCAFYPSLSLKDIKKKVTFVFVYNDAAGKEQISQSRAMEQMKDKLFELSDRPKIILYGLEAYKDTFYKDVYTIDRTEFIKDDMWKMIFGQGTNK